ncbi:cyclic lactone autoinducer peptide [Metallumcola ferriviriculae]|uniref:Cyclic lactone autoinducer peptide n=1 Tax=Metallumcola ferriviriculae TaxID=3039180 RepID=A0AAU0UJE0_9FIRM|nr:cyclic lactone autoinducer peptide [Desulfitibacteraceae bacterium MK1]
MLKKIKVWSLSSLASVALFTALMGVSTQSWWSLYEPDVPEALK